MTVKQRLRALQIKYALLYQAKLKIIDQETTHIFQSPEDVWTWLHAKVLVEATEEEKDADTWITPKLRRLRRKPVSSLPNQEQVALERDRAVSTATRCCKHPSNTLCMEHTQSSGSETGSEISETGSNKAPHVKPDSVDDII
ncbi:hypothetical protein NDU88_007735 [Pleurodeles waltl]|uniref:Uncharacterized protein n=1 Tax=Pleurodeles waltl TaxID=8319 RepID=A0AAV7VT92_PLEWA|nr:hypothetical protein NDU88_007735 [Pleurodeles waltl]